MKMIKDNGIKILFCFVIIASLMLVLESPAQAAISGATVKTNLSTNQSANVYGGVDATDRCQIAANCTINITFTESMPTKYINVSFPSGFTFGGLYAENITNNTVGTTILKSGQWVNISYTEKAAGILTFNFTTNVKMPGTSGRHPINISTNATATQTVLNVCARDPAYPFFVSANNTAFTTTCGTPTETFGTATTAITLSGSGVSNFTFFAPNITTQTNVSVGYGATNATVVKTNYTAGQIPNNTVWVVVSGSVTNPIVNLSNPKELQSENLPYAVATGGLIGALVMLYVIKRRTR